MKEPCHDMAIGIIRAAVYRAQQDGIPISPSRYGVVPDGGVWHRSEGLLGRSICPLGAVLLGRPTQSHVAWEDAARVLGVNQTWVDSYEHGLLDYLKPGRVMPDPAAYSAGRALAAELFGDEAP